jgi:phytoene/squalene synthetase
MQQSIALRRPRIEYYAWRHLPYATFQQLNAILTLVDTLNRIPVDVTEPHVARMKLAFFQSDIARAQNDQAQHPEVQALDKNLDLSAFNDLFIALETEIDRVQLVDDHERNRYYRRKRGSVMLLCGQVLKKAPLTDDEKIELNSLGIAIERNQTTTSTTPCFAPLRLFALLNQAPYNPIQLLALSLYYRIKGC